MKREKVIEAGGNYFTGVKRNMKYIPSGSKLLDLALGGGWAESRIINIVGNRSSGKTLLAIEACTNFAIKYPKGKIRYRECESAFDPDYAAAIGTPIDRIDFDVNLETVEDLYNDLGSVIKNSKSEELYIVDSLDALSDEAELEREFAEGSYGTSKAKNMSKMFRMLTSKLSGSKVTLIIISQVRDKIGFTGKGKKTTRSGGRALDFYASQVVMLSELGKLYKTYAGLKRPTCLIIKAMVEKNKVGMPFRDAEFEIRFGYGVDDVQSCLKWMETIKHLKDLEITKIGDYLNDLDHMPDNEHRAAVSDIHTAVTKRWNEIEEHFLPVRRKY